jgi:hypothetical protein
MVLKGNQPTLLRDCLAATAQPPRQPVRTVGPARSLEVAHGRIEERALRVVEAPPDLGFPHVRQVLRIHRRSRSKRTGALLFEETVCALTSLSPTQARPADLLALWRAHWRVESVHWLRDAVFGEDRSTTRSGTAPQVLAAFRNLALSFIQQRPGRQVTAAREYYAAHPAILFRHLGLPSRRL